MFRRGEVVPVFNLFQDSKKFLNQDNWCSLLFVHESGGVGSQCVFSKPVFVGLQHKVRFVKGEDDFSKTYKKV